MRNLKILVESAVLVSGSLAAGFLIGTAQHFVSFGVWGYGFGKGAFNLARLEGGTLGELFAVPTGLIAYYAILKRHVTAKQVAVVLLGSLVAGCALGIALFWVSALFTPILTKRLLTGSVGTCRRLGRLAQGCSSFQAGWRHLNQSRRDSLPLGLS